MDKSDLDPWPTALRLAPDGTRLEIDFAGAEQFALSAEYLRVMSPSAEVQGHNANQRKTVGGKRGVLISGIEPVGTYAVRLRFDDGHDTGIYSWSTLHALGREREARWSAYRQDLAAKGLTRDRPGQA